MSFQSNFNMPEDTGPDGDLPDEQMEQEATSGAFEVNAPIADMAWADMRTDMSDPPDPGHLDHTTPNFDAGQAAWDSVRKNL